jgi:hypothetical protein
MKDEMHSRVRGMTAGRRFPTASAAVAVLLSLLVFESGLLTGLPSVEAAATLARSSSTASAADVSKNAKTAADDASLEAPPSLAADLSASGARLRWENPARNLTVNRTRQRARFGPSDPAAGSPDGRNPLHSPFGAASVRNANLATHRLLLQTAQLAAG